MDKEQENISLSLLLQSLEDDFDNEERLRVFELLKSTNSTDDSLLGAKMILESNNWDYTVLKKAFAKTENRIEAIASKTKKRSNSYYLKYAAVLIPLTFVLGYFVSNLLNDKQSKDNLYPKEEGLPNYMGTEKTNWDDLMQLYRANKMKAAFIVSQELLTQKPQNDTAIYFHGVIGYELKNFKVARTDFTKVSENKGSVFYYDATFRLGFALKNLQELKTAKQQFEKVANDDTNPFKEKAKAVLKEF